MAGSIPPTPVDKPLFSTSAPVLHTPLSFGSVPFAVGGRSPCSPKHFFLCLNQIKLCCFLLALENRGKMGQQVKISPNHCEAEREAHLATPTRYSWKCSLSKVDRSKLSVQMKTSHGVSSRATLEHMKTRGFIQDEW